MLHKFIPSMLATGMVTGLCLYSQTTQTPAPTTGGGGTTTSPTAPGGGSNTPTTRTPTIPNPNSTPTTSPFPTDMPRPIYISGRVMMEDGTAPPESLVIERVCNGQPRPEGYTDSKGRFNFELGHNQGVMADASTSGGSFDSDFGRSSSSRMPGERSGVTERSLTGCEIRASLAGYRSSVISLAGRRISCTRQPMQVCSERRITAFSAHPTSYPRSS